MERKKIQFFQQRLLQEKKALQEEVQNINSQLQENLKDSVGELSSYDNHSSDLSDVTFERGKDIALRDSTLILEDKVEQALKKIEEGNYGFCADCGKKISEERLDALPYATLCLDCQEKVDQERRNVRPLEEEVFPHSFGDLNNDRLDKTCTDGEDIQQILENYGTANSPQDIPGAVSYKDLSQEGDEYLGVVQSVENITQEEYEEAMK